MRSVDQVRTRKRQKATSLSAKETVSTPLAALERAPIERVDRVADQVYRHLRGAITSGKIAAGTRLREAEIAAALKVSRTPVREAISRLLGDWLVRELPTHGVEVVDMRSELADVFAIREALEICAARLAAKRITAIQLDELEQLVESAVGASFKTRVKINQEFHMAIAQATGSARLMSMITDFRDYYLTPRWVTRDDDAVAEQALQEHRAIVAALRARSPQRVEAALRAHLKLGWEQLAIGLEQNG